MTYRGVADNRPVCCYLDHHHNEEDEAPHIMWPHQGATLHWHLYITCLYIYMIEVIDSCNTTWIEGLKHIVKVAARF